MNTDVFYHVEFTHALCLPPEREWTTFVKAREIKSNGFNVIIKLENLKILEIGADQISFIMDL